MYLFQGKVKDLLADIEKNMKLKVTHDVQPENEIIINAVWCDMGSHKVSEDKIVSKYDQSVCEDCNEQFTERWD